MNDLILKSKITLLQISNFRNNYMRGKKTIMNLQRTLDDKDKELHAIRLEHEAISIAWAKEDLLREQDKDLATFRRELDNSEAERAQHLKKSMNYKNMLKKRNDN